MAGVQAIDALGKFWRTKGGYDIYRTLGEQRQKIYKYVKPGENTVSREIQMGIRQGTNPRTLRIENGLTTDTVYRNGTRTTYPGISRTTYQGEGRPWMGENRIIDNVVLSSDGKTIQHITNSQQQMYNGYVRIPTNYGCQFDPEIGVTKIFKTNCEGQEHAVFQPLKNAPMWASLKDALGLNKNLSKNLT